MSRLRDILMLVPRSKWGKQAFLLRMRGKGAKILDVGCGNNSPVLTRKLAPDCHYVGIDVADYNNTEASLAYADQYILVKPEQFAEGIEGTGEDFDAVISSHNIEHCNHPRETVLAMCRRLKSGGASFLIVSKRGQCRFSTS